MNRISVDELKLNQKKYFKNVSSEIMLCCLYITDNLIATGNKDGSLIFYDEKGNVIHVVKFTVDTLPTHR